MARKQIMEMFFAVMFLNCLLLAQNHSISEAPTPQPQSGGGNSPDPMHGVTEGSLEPEECGGRCAGRCSKTAFKKPCMFFCQKCCAKCLCVPYGTYGNKQSCPCYNEWKTKRGGPKCP
ncbi:protein GAST1-like [Cucurbita pepo subsp. pepo]|uniref:protein GAST1-like n=1 Tax=Cucurbita pepo subsp. pepo TaxID=3664 RepID=UPI000C9D6297|nr:protein GAST1-like [Cucurbita pepo subsp. pepo]